MSTQHQIIRALQDLITNHDVQLRRLPDDVINEFRAISDDILTSSAENDADVKKVYESFQKIYGRS